jgi:two-component system CheB/CheR fusion protein
MATGDTSLVPVDTESPGAFSVVGIGASAGGLAAFEAYFSAMPKGAPTGMAFVLVQHLLPDHKSILSELVRRFTDMPVFDVVDGMRVTPDHVYVIPPGCDMKIQGGVLQLLEPEAPHGLRLPIDFFFRSLAADLGERAICAVLSGSGNDGTLGVRAIKGEGGLVLAQSPETAEFDSMPKGAIATGKVDAVLPPGEMPALLASYVDHVFVKLPAAHDPASGDVDDTLNQIYAVLRLQTGHDFSQYKDNTLNRRMERRMALHRIDRPGDYLTYLKQEPAEAEALFHDFLIGVTSFFRDPRAFAAVAEQVVPGLFVDQPEGGTIRAWVCGCSTGEEAYSLAILLHEHCLTMERVYRIQVFATDIDRRAIAQARRGVYPLSIATDVTPERLQRYFIRDQEAETFRVRKEIRDLVVFSEHDLIRDPPFSRLNLISCRNLLIYLKGELQSRVMSLFHYSLCSGGTLFLGTSETVGSQSSQFIPLDRKWKLFGRRGLGLVRQAAGAFPTKLPDRTLHTPPSEGIGSDEVVINYRKVTEQALLRHCVQVAVLVNRLGEIHHIHGRTGMYLEPAPGAAAMNILAMARDGLHRELATALRMASNSGEPVFRPRLRVKTNGEHSLVDLTVKRLPATGDETRELYLVLLDGSASVEPSSQGAPAVDAGDVPSESASGRIAELEQELLIKEEFLQSTLEEMETANEELRSANEELQSVNEELQSTNEELETSKEELQSLNEELATVNTELQDKVADLMLASNDMSNLLASTGIGTLFVDHNLRIMRFTPAVTEQINLIKSDEGRPIAHIVSNLVGYDRLVEDVQSVLDTLTPVEVEVATTEGNWFMMRIRPYRTHENVIEGAVLTFVNISDLKALESDLRGARHMQRLAAVLSDSSDAILVLDPDGRITDWNHGAERMYGWTEAEALEMRIADLSPAAQEPDFPALLAALERDEPVSSFRTRRVTKDGDVLDIWLTSTALVDSAGRLAAVATTERDLGALPTDGTN